MRPTKTSPRICYLSKDVLSSPRRSPRADYKTGGCAESTRAWKQRLLCSRHKADICLEDRPRRRIYPSTPQDRPVSPRIPETETSSLTTAHCSVTDAVTLASKLSVD